jgi:hypothetical protein
MLMLLDSLSIPIKHKSRNAVQPGHHLLMNQGERRIQVAQRQIRFIL